MTVITKSDILDRSLSVEEVIDKYKHFQMNERRIAEFILTTKLNSTIKTDKETAKRFKEHILWNNQFNIVEEWESSPGILRNKEDALDNAEEVKHLLYSTP